MVEVGKPRMVDHLHLTCKRLTAYMDTQVGTQVGTQQHQAKVGVGTGGHLLKVGTDIGQVVGCQPSLHHPPRTPPPFCMVNQRRIRIPKDCLSSRLGGSYRCDD